LQIEPSDFETRGYRRYRRRLKGTYFIEQRNRNNVRASVKQRTFIIAATFSRLFSSSSYIKAIQFMAMLVNVEPRPKEASQKRRSPVSIG
jgi:hypothetical protein